MGDIRIEAGHIHRDQDRALRRLDVLDFTEEGARVFYVRGEAFHDWLQVEVHEFCYAG